MTVTSDIDGSMPVESSAAAVNWGPVIAGALTAAAASLILMMLGSGLGLTIVSPWQAEGVSVTTFAMSTAIWFIVVQWLSSALGGYLTGRLRTKWVGIHTDEVYFRDAAHGFLAWALATLIVVGVLGSALTAMVGSGVHAASTAISGAAMGAGTDDNTTPSASDGTSYFVDILFRPVDAGSFSGGPEAIAEAAAQTSRILIQSAAAGVISADDQTYLAQLVSARTGLSQLDAEKRVDALVARVEQAEITAQEAADTARKAVATFALVGALSLVLGGFIASAAAMLGGRQRDDEVVEAAPRNLP